MHVLGTAGHVDHGKSSLVRALTGTNPDRLIEEQLRGMTLDLGFAHLSFEDGVEAGIVDVPGHERFLHNMLAGAAGMELLLLVVAANEGPRRQTLEHLAMLAYLNVRGTIVVLSKSDTVDAEELALSQELLTDAVAGTLAEGAPIVPVSALTGAGIDDLRAAIHTALLELPPRSPNAPPYLPIDRVFALSGHGTIVTGTLMQGRIAVGDRLTLTPLGREARVRGLHVFGDRRDRVEGGARVAVNLAGVDRAEIARGTVLASSQFVGRSDLPVRFRAFKPALGLLKRRMPVRVYLGSAEILGTLILSAVPSDDGEVAAALHLRVPAIAFPGAAFVLRRLSPKSLLGGGVVGANDPMESAEPRGELPETDAVLRALRDAGIVGVVPARAGASANVREDVAELILTEAVARGEAMRVLKPAAFVDGALAEDLIGSAVAHLEASESKTPWSPGETLLGLSRMLNAPEQALGRILAAARDATALVYRGGYYTTPHFHPKLSSEQSMFFDRVFAAGEPLVPVSLEAVQATMRASKIVGLAQAFETLLLSEALVKVGDAVYRGTQITEARAKLEAALRRDKQITMAAFRDLVGTSRKFSVPLLEWFDASGLTVRSGDVRTLRSSPPSQQSS